MKKLLVSAVLSVDDNCSSEMLSRMLMSASNPDLHGSTVMIQSVHFRPTEGLNRNVWIYVSPEEDDPYFLVRNAPDRSDKRPLTDVETDRLFAEGVCVGMFGAYPRGSHYGVPGWVGGSKAYTIPSMDGFFVSEHFNSMSEDSGDDTPESFWYQIALSEESNLLEDASTQKLPKETLSHE